MGVWLGQSISGRSNTPTPHTVMQQEHTEANTANRTRKRSPLSYNGPQCMLLTKLHMMLVIKEKGSIPYTDYWRMNSELRVNKIRFGKSISGFHM